ncbi:hypothetical protein BJ508DRAFT_82571 [Ascobolus immersus RN42]|uniref:BTB domain-containing protein n=1 Tax=Ascobolus immersus RN42 TaxID=1160509 RepID=A0A3N4HC16_ASCIM|nr:hypothetical protein BJ508DRAFT_82571 [Ascobolus immersus RN42]
MLGNAYIVPPTTKDDGFPTPSTICTALSPIITICLLQPPSSEASTESLPPDLRKSRKHADKPTKKRKKADNSDDERKDGKRSKGTRSKTQATNGDTSTDSEEYLATFQVHVAALVSRSLYFKSLISFDGLEASQNKVLFECPSGGDPKLNKLAFGCFIDHCYAGRFELAKYTKDLEPNASETSVEDTEQKEGTQDTVASDPVANQPAVGIPTGYGTLGEFRYRSGDLIVFLAVLYCMGERLLADSFKQEVLKDMYALLKGYQNRRRDRRYLPPSSVLDSLSLKHIEQAARIVFEGTISKRFSLPSSTQQKPPLPPTRAPRTAISTESREKWLEGDPMRNLLAAFLAGQWSDDGTGTEMDDKMETLERLPDLRRLVLSYLMIPGQRSLEDIPNSDFGFSNGDYLEGY